jgi:hypothetical protein
VALRDVTLYAGGNLGVRMPPDVLGLDVDNYGGKQGGASFDNAVQTLGELPGTYRSTSRGAEDLSGIRFFRVPAGLHWKWPEQFGGHVDIIQRVHRYAVVAPSVHPEGRFYQWFDEDGAQCDMPSVTDLPELPSHWVEALSQQLAGGEAAVEPASIEVVNQWLRRGAPCTAMKAAKERHLAALGAGEGSAHDLALKAFMHVCKLQGEGHSGTHSTARGIRDAFIYNVTVAGRKGVLRSETEAKIETLSLLSWAVAVGQREDVKAGACRCPDRKVEDSVEAPVIPEARKGGLPLLDLGAENAAIAELRRSISLGDEGSFGDLFNTFEGLVVVREDRPDGGRYVHRVHRDTLASLVNQRFEVGVWGKGNDPTFIKRRFRADLAADLTSAPFNSGARWLSEVLTTPVFSASGRLVRAGYDPDNTTYLIPSCDVPDSPEPSQKEAVRALEELWEPWSEFPFEDDDSRANLIGMLLTPFLRFISPPPWRLGVVVASSAETGKSLLAESIGAFHGGSMNVTAPSTEQEMQKSLLSVLKAQGPSVVTFDNLASNGLFHSDSFCQVLTSATYSGRILGGNNVAQVRNTKMWLATGNNPRFGPEMHRRTLAVRLDLRGQQAGGRSFAIRDLKAHVVEHRGRLVGAALSAVSCWLAGGRPPSSVKAMGEFGRHENVVNGILAYGGFEGVFQGPNGGGPELDSEETEWADFLCELMAWKRSFTALELHDHLMLYDESPSELRFKPGNFSAVLPRTLAGCYAPAARGLMTHQRLAAFLRNRLKRDFEGRMLVSIPRENGRGRMVFKVVQRAS